MDWSDVKTVVRLWSLRPWLFSWSIIPLADADNMVDMRWRRWFRDTKLTEKDESNQELKDWELQMVDNIYNIHYLVFEDEREFYKNVGDMEKIKMLIYKMSTFGDWLTNITTKARGIKAIQLWINKLPEETEKNILLLIFVCYNYCTLLKVVDRLDGGIHTILSKMFKEDSEVQKKKDEGNRAFTSQQYIKAIEMYTLGLHKQVYNHKLYSNRAQAYLQSEHPRAAASDGLRCIRIEPRWDKGWYRYAQGLFRMGHLINAWCANEEGRSRFPEDKNMLLQAEELQKNDDIAKYIANQLKQKTSKATKSKLEETNLMNGHAVGQKSEYRTLKDVERGPTTEEEEEDLPDLVSDEDYADDEPEVPSKLPSKRSNEIGSKSKAKTSQSHTTQSKAKVTEVKVTQPKVKHAKSQQTIPIVMPPETGSMTAEKKSNVTDGKTKKAAGKSGKGVGVNNNNNNTLNKKKSSAEVKPVESVAVREIRALLQQASTAFIEKRMRNAVTTYTQALGRLDPAMQKEMGYQNDQMAVVMYALGVSNVNIGTEKEVQDGLHHFEEILSKFQGLVFPLAYLGIGSAYCKWNRYHTAIEPLAKGLRIANKHELLTVYAWPESNTCIEDSKKDKMIASFESMLAQCRQPPPPLATCLYTDCSHIKIEIYISDPDFKGYVEVRCYAHCRLAYHQDCWKKSKTASIKEILSGVCFTPDCGAPLKNILMYDHTGEVATEKDNPLPNKEPKPRKPALKLPPSSQYTLMRKRDRKLRRKQKREDERKKKEEAGQIDDLIEDVEAAANKTESDQKPAPPVDLTSCTKIMPRREDETREDETKKLKKKRRTNQQRTVIRLDLPLDQSIVPPDLTRPPPPGPFGELDDFEDLNTYLSLNAEAPFDVPAHLAADVALLEEVTSGSRKSSISLASRSASGSLSHSASRSASPAVSETADRDREIDDANNRQAIRESLFQLFKGILQTHGPLPIDDLNITSQFAEFPPETMQIIESEGGIGSFLKKSITFTMIEDIVGLVKDSNKIRKVVNKRKAQLRKSATTERRSKKTIPGPIPAHVKEDSPSPSTSMDRSYRSGSADRDSDRDSLASTDTGCSESVDIVSNSSRNSSSLNHLSRLPIGLSPISKQSDTKDTKSSPWKRHPSEPMENLQFTEMDPRSADNPVYVDKSSPKASRADVLAKYRLGANRLQAAVELGRLAHRVRVRLGVEVRFLYGWTLTAGLEDADAQTRDEASALLQEAITLVTSTSNVVYNTNGAEVYFFGLGQSSVDGERAQWVNGPEVANNHGIVLALALDHVEMSSVVTAGLSPAETEALHAVHTAATAVRAVSDRFKASMEIKKALLPIFEAVGRCVASNKPETLALLKSGIPTSKPPPGLGLNTAILPPGSPITAPRVNSPIARPASSSGSSSASPSRTPSVSAATPPILSQPASFSSSIWGQGLMSGLSTNDLSAGGLTSLSASGLTSPGLSVGGLTGFTSLSAGGLTSTGLSANPFSASGLSTSGLTAPSMSSPGLSVGGLPTGSLASGLSTFNTAGLFDYSLPPPNLPQAPLFGADALSQQRQDMASQQLHNQLMEGMQQKVTKLTNRNEELMATSDHQTVQITTLQEHLKKVQGELEAQSAHFNKCEQRWHADQRDGHIEMEQLRQKLQAMKLSSEEAQNESKKTISELKSKAQRERDLRVATESQYEEVVRDRVQAHTTLEMEHAEERQRAETAEMALLQLKLEVGLQIIDRSTKEAELFIGKIRAQAKQFTDQMMSVPKAYTTAEDAWMTTLNKIRVTRDQAEASFKDQKERIKNGTRLQDLPQLDIPRPPPAPEMPHLPHPQMMAQHHMMGNGDASSKSFYETSGKVTPPTVQSLPTPSSGITSSTVSSGYSSTMAGFAAKARQLPTAASIVSRPPPPQPAPTRTRPPGFSGAHGAGASRPKNSFDRIVDTIQSKFPHFDRKKISTFLQLLRKSRNGSLSGMKMEDVLMHVEAFIQQEQVQAGYSAAGGSAFSMSSLDQVTLDTYQEEDPCTICLEELQPYNQQELDCRHRFHADCIRQWLREKSTCPNCNKHALLADEFPALC